MSVLAFLVPVTLGLGIVGLAAFFWSLRSGQYEDLSGAAERVLLDAEDDGAARTPSTDQGAFAMISRLTGAERRDRPDHPGC